MRRLFPILALIGGLLLAASFLGGMASPGKGHARLGLIAALATLGIHGAVTIYLLRAVRLVEATAGRLGMPEWVAAQAEKNLRKCSIYQTLGVPAIILVVWSGRDGGRWWHLVLSASALTFQLGAFVGESLMVVAQARLLRDVAGWAGRTAPIAASSDP